MAVNQTPEPGPAPDQESGSLVILALVSLLAGALSGLVGAAFRLILQQADRYRGLFISWAHDHHFFGFFLVICVTAGDGHRGLAGAPDFAPGQRQRHPPRGGFHLFGVVCTLVTYSYFQLSP